jgi:hypothetical protein
MERENCSIMVKLVEPQLQCDQSLWMESFSNAPVLAPFLRSEGADCVGILHLRIKNVPPIVKEKLKKGEHFLAHCEIKQFWLGMTTRE